MALHARTDVLRWPYPASTLSLPSSQVLALLSPLGLGDPHSVATQVLQLLGERVPFAQCTIFAFDAQGSPQTVGVGDRSRTRELPQIARAYTQHYWRLDPLLQVMATHQSQARRQSPEAPLIVLHRQSPQDLKHAAYRRTCYDLPNISERLAILSWHGDDHWISLNLYRGCEHGRLSDAEWEALRTFAPLVVHAVRLHHASSMTRADLRPLMLERLKRRQPNLSGRDWDVVRALLDGLDHEAMAQRLGLQASSAPTYTKRLYRKLGVSGRRELLAQLLAEV